MQWMPEQVISTVKSIILIPEYVQLNKPHVKPSILLLI